MLPLLVALLVSAEYLDDVSCRPLREARTALIEDWLIKAVHYMESNPETLEELMSDEHTVLEGDMVLTSDRNAVASSWPTLELPYVISPDLAGRTDDIMSAMAMVSKHTCVTFHPRTTEKSYLHFITSRGCASFVGFQGGEQPVFVGSQCMVGNIVHEILHALGFHHEHTRMDREQYITILSHNIMSGMEKNFQKHEGETFELPYDITSIMHYGSGFFSNNGLPTILANKEAGDMGQRVKMTDMDIKRVQQLYNCDGAKHRPEEGNTAAAAQEMKEEDVNTHSSIAHRLVYDSAQASTAAPGHSHQRAQSHQQTPA